MLKCKHICFKKVFFPFFSCHVLFINLNLIWQFNFFKWHLPIITVCNNTLKRTQINLTKLWNVKYILQCRTKMHTISISETINVRMFTKSFMVLSIYNNLQHWKPSLQRDNIIESIVKLFIYKETLCLCK